MDARLLARCRHPHRTPRSVRRHRARPRLRPDPHRAEESAGFRWRLQSENGNATDVVAFEWDRADGDAGVIVNLSTWADAEALRAFVFGGDHVAYLRRRREWFVPITEAYAVCWWVEAGHRPTTDEAEERVRHRRAHGSTPHAFDLRRPHPRPHAAP